MHLQGNSLILHVLTFKEKVKKALINTYWVFSAWKQDIPVCYRTQSQNKVLCPKTHPELMNRQNTVLIKQFPEHTLKTEQEIINMLFTWNGKEKSKLAGQPAEHTGPAQQSSPNGQIPNCDAVHPEPTDLETLRPPTRAAHPEERPSPSSVGTDTPGHTYMDRHLKKLSLARSSNSPRNVWELPGRPSAEAQQHKQGQESKARQNPHPTHSLCTDSRKGSL